MITVYRAGLFSDFREDEVQLALMREFTPEPERRVSSKNVVLTSRDLEVIEFIIDMKFASVEDIFEKFFKVTLNSAEAKSDHWARKRLFQLEQGKFLRAQKVQTEKHTYYSATFKGYYALSNVFPEKSFVKPVGGFDARTFIHDKLVLKCRLDLESRLGCNHWISDRVYLFLGMTCSFLGPDHIIDPGPV